MDRKTIFAFILIGIVILFWNEYYKLIHPPSPEDLSRLSEEMSDTISTRSTLDDRKPEYHYDEGRISPEKEEDAAISEETPELILESEEVIPEKYVIVETDYYRAKLSSYGARLVSYTLKPSQRYLKKEIHLLHENGNNHLGFRFWTYEGPIETSDRAYSISSDYAIDTLRITVSPGGKRNVEFVADLGNDRKLNVIYTFEGEGYSFLYKVKGEGTDGLWVRDNAEAYWRGGLAFTEPDTGQDIYYSKAYNYFTNDVLEKMKISGKKVEQDTINGDALWAALRTKYFMAAFIPENIHASGAWMESLLDSNYVGKHQPNFLGVGLLIPHSGGSPVSPIRVYLGPLDDELLAQVQPDLKRAMTWGAGIPGVDAIVKPISKLILWALKALRTVIPNYGICIIIFSVLIKLVIWPLTRKSYQSMAGMQRLQPKMKAVREKFKEDPQRMQKEIMKLYREEKVNPMGGCFPILLQMPLLYGLFIVFRSTIEFRRAPFIWWINDLSLPDIIFHLPFSLPLYGSHVALLPLVMGVTSFFQSKSTMSDPNQKMILYFMPIFLTLIFNQFPSGLTLYYTLFNIWTLVQQKITPPPSKPATADNK